MTDQEHAQWDARYAESERIWSGHPNGCLVAEVAGLTPGRVLDVGCGEGADAVWLAQQGWQVTALDVSAVALARAAAHARDAGVEVTWIHSGLIEAGLPAGSFDLVSAQYPAVRRTPTLDAERALLDAVAPGGALLFVHHAHFTDGHDHDHHTEFDPADYVGIEQMRPLLAGDWDLVVDAVRPRTLVAGAGAGHTEDEVLRAVRRR